VRDDGLVRSEITGPGILRRRHGRGFRCLGPRDAPVTDPATLSRIKALVIPPAWEDVWICPDPDGHIQAVGTDAAGRRQYRYHDRWRELRDREKFDRMLEFGRTVFSVVRSLKLRRSRPDLEDLLVYRSGERWHNVTAGDINEYLREISGDDYTAKDFRTWHATVLAAAGLAVSVRAAESPTARKRAITRVVKEVASYLGNTPAVARASYIDPRVIARYEEGDTIASALADLGKGQGFGDAATHGRAERAVLDLLTAG